MMLSTDPKAKEFDPPPSEICEYCGKELPILGYEAGNRVLWMHAITCDCEGVKEAEERERMAAEANRLKGIREGVINRIGSAIGDPGPGRRFRSRTFETFKADGENLITWKVAKRYAERFMTSAEGDERNGLLITGPVGTGKTHLAAAIANRLKADTIPLIFMNSTELLEKIKETWSEQEKGKEEKVLKFYKTVDLLVIDDLGKEQPTEWAVSKLFQIINARYEEMKPLIITTNYTLEQLKDRLTPKSGDSKTAEAIVDRLAEMVYTLPLGGTSHRGK